MQTAINRQECTIKIYAKNFLPSSNMKTMTTCPVKIMGYPAFDDFLYLYNENRYAKIIGEKIQEQIGVPPTVVGATVGKVW